MSPQWLLTLKGSALLSRLWEEGGGGGGQEAGITEVTPPCLERCPGWIVLSTKAGRGWCCQPVIEVHGLDWYPCLAVLCQAPWCWLVILICLTTSLFCRPPLGSSLFVCLWISIFAQSDAKMFRIPPNPPRLLFNVSFLWCVVWLLSQLPNETSGCIPTHQSRKAFKFFIYLFIFFASGFDLFDWWSCFSNCNFAWQKFMSGEFYVIITAALNS